MAFKLSTYLAGISTNVASSGTLAIERMEAKGMMESEESESPYRFSREGRDAPDMCDRIACIYSKRSKSLSNLFHFRTAGEHAEIVTPFLDPTNSRISVFIKSAGEDFQICDGGLAFRIVDMAARADGESILEAMVQDYGLTVTGRSLHVLSSEADLLAKQFRLCNALVSLRDRLSSESGQQI